MAGKNKNQQPAKPNVAGPFDSKQVALLEHEHEIPFLRYSPCGKYLFGGSYDSNIYRWQVQVQTSSETLPGELADPVAPKIEIKKETLPAHKAWVQGIVFHPDKKRMFSVDSWGTLCCWNYADATPKPTWTIPEGHKRWVRSLAISLDGALLATCGADRIIKLWSTEDGKLNWESPVQPNSLFSVQFHPKGDLVVGDQMGNVTHWDLAGKKTVREFDAKILYSKPVILGVPDINDVGGVRGLAFSHDGKTLACCGAEPMSSGFFTCKPAIALIDWESGKQTQILQWEGADPQDGVTLDVIAHPDGYFMAGSSGQAGHGALYSWKPGDKAPLYINKNMFNNRSLALHPDGKTLAVAQVHQATGGHAGAGNGRHASEAAEYLGFVSGIRVFQAKA